MLALAVFFLLVSAALANPVLVVRANPKGIDVSGFQPNFDWKAVRARGVTFAFIKATEGITFKSSTFSSQYTGARKEGIIRGAYHFAHPNLSSGAKQAEFFLAHGGGWSKDGITLPGALDIEYNPNGAECYGLRMPAWWRGSKSFMIPITPKPPVIYTTLDWWTTCTGNSSAFGPTSPLWLARFSSTSGAVPRGWSTYTFWQYADSGLNPGDQDVFNGDEARLKKLAIG